IDRAQIGGQFEDLSRREIFADRWSVDLDYGRSCLGDGYFGSGRAELEFQILPDGAVGIDGEFRIFQITETRSGSGELVGAWNEIREGVSACRICFGGLLYAGTNVRQRERGIGDVGAGGIGSQAADRPQRRLGE